MKKLSFPYTVDYIELGDDDIFVLPDDIAVRSLEKQILDAQEYLADPDNQDADKRKFQEQLIKFTEQSIGQINKIRKEHADVIKQYKFVMHRYGWNEKELIKEESRIYNPDGSVSVDQAAHTLSLMVSCIDSWSGPRLEEKDEQGNVRVFPITEETVGALPPAVFDSVYRKLVDKSEPSAARLAFLRPGSA